MRTKKRLRIGRRLLSKRVVFPVMRTSTLPKRRYSQRPRLSQNRVLPQLVDYNFAYRSSALHNLLFFKSLGTLVYTNRLMQWHAYHDLQLTAGTTLGRLEIFTTDTCTLVKSIPQRPSRCISQSLSPPYTALSAVPSAIRSTRRERSGANLLASLQITDRDSPNRRPAFLRRQKHHTCGSTTTRTLLFQVS
jgi:hypothetical protein